MCLLAAARPMLEAGTSYARLLPRGQTNAGGWDFTAQRPYQCWSLGLHCPEARPMLEAGTSYARLLPRGQTNAGGWDFTAQRPDQCWRLGLHCPERATHPSATQLRFPDVRQGPPALAPPVPPADRHLACSPDPAPESLWRTHDTRQHPIPTMWRHASHHLTRLDGCLAQLHRHRHGSFTGMAVFPARSITSMPLGNRCDCVLCCVCCGLIPHYTTAPVQQVIWVRTTFSNAVSCVMCETWRKQKGLNILCALRVRPDVKTCRKHKGGQACRQRPRDDERQHSRRSGVPRAFRIRRVWAMPPPRHDSNLLLMY
jgi:hypothetical protein